MPTALRTSSIGGFLVACYHLPDKNWHALKSNWTLLAGRARLHLLAAGVPLKRQILIVRCLGGDDSSGLFSDFITVLGALEHHERWSQQYAGLQIDFADQGLYFDPDHGTNWWQYYFDPIDFRSRANAIVRVATPFELENFSSVIDRMSRERGSALIGRHIRPRRHIREKVDSYIRENFGDAYVIGIHYRGTDKSMEAPRVPFEQVYAAVRAAVSKARPGRHKLFIATDEQAFLDYMLDLYPNGLLYREMFRSVDGKPTHWRDANNYDKGEDALLDSLLLSRCNCLVRTESSLSLCSTFFNPDLPGILVHCE